MLVMHIATHRGMLTKLNKTKEPHFACAPPSSCECTDSRTIRRSLAMPGFGWQLDMLDLEVEKSLMKKNKNIKRTYRPRIYITLHGLSFQF